MRIRIDYYTGTGGSEFVADRLAAELSGRGCEVLKNRIIRDCFVDSDDYDYYVLLFAVHSFNAPRPVFEWVHKLDGKGRPCGVVAVGGGGESSSNSACRRKITRKLSRSHYAVQYETTLMMPNNWMQVPPQELCYEILRQLPVEVKEVAEAIFEQRKQRRRAGLLGLFLSAVGESEKMITKKFGRRIVVGDRCTGCGLCARNCCSANIRIREGKAVFGGRCDMCLGCLYGCPQGALKATFWGFQVDKRGYRLSEMLQEKKDLPSVDQKIK